MGCESSAMIYIISKLNSNYKTIGEIGRFKAKDITKICFQYDNPSIIGGTVEEKKR